MLMLEYHHGVPLPTAGGACDAISTFSRCQRPPPDGGWGEHCSGPHIQPHDQFMSAGPTLVQEE